jgi:hypothetical protein
MPEVTTTPEESRKEVEWIVPSTTTTSTLLALLQTFMPVLVIDLSRLWVGKGFVSFGDFNKLLLCSSIPSIRALAEV